MFSGEPTPRDSGAEYSRKKGAKEYMSSKPGSLPFVDDSPPGLGSAETPSEATISARVAATKSSQMAADLVNFFEVRTLDSLREFRGSLPSFQRMPRPHVSATLRWQSVDLSKRFKRSRDHLRGRHDKFPPIFLSCPLAFRRGVTWQKILLFAASSKSTSEVYLSRPNC